MAKETTISSIVAIIGLVTNEFLGGWDIGLQLLISFMVIDYVTGVLGAIKQRTLNSEVMFWGGVKKSFILVVLALAILLDQMVGNSGPVFRTLAIFFYVGKEGLSVVENLGIIGVPLPDFFYKVLSQFEEKGSDKK